jgi:hypothetical protein
LELLSHDHLSLAVGVAGLLWAGTAHADTAALQITSFYQIVADTAHNHLFISQGSSSQNHIIVTTLSGNLVATIGRPRPIGQFQQLREPAGPGSRSRWLRVHPGLRLAVRSLPL